MVGAGSRFVTAGYPRPKYEIQVGGRPLFDWSMMASDAFVQDGWEVSFAVRAEQDAPAYLRGRCEALGIAVGGVIELDALTDGQATTALYLAQTAPPDRPFLVFNIDTFVAPGAMSPAQIDPAASGWVPCFPGPGEGWSFARTDAAGRVMEMREKVRISDDATLGLYWFRSAELFVDTYRRFFADGAGTEHGERYIAPMYNLLLERGEVVTISRVPLEEVGMLGTPDQVEAFRATLPAGALPYLR